LAYSAQRLCVWLHMQQGGALWLKMHLLKNTNDVCRISVLKLCI